MTDTEVQRRRADLIRAAGIGVLIALGALEAWYFRRWPARSDGVSYVDLALGAADGGVGRLLNEYWSPLFPTLLAIAYKLAPPSMETLYPTARLVVFSTFVLSCLALSRLLSRMATARPDAPLSPRATVTLNVTIATLYGAFALRGISLRTIGADFLVCAAFFWAVSEGLGPTAAGRLIARWVALGTALGLGFLAKTAMFPIGVMVLAWQTIEARADKAQRRNALGAWLALAAFVAMVAVPLSLRLGKPTFGEVARTNHLWFVEKLPFATERCLQPTTPEFTAASQSGLALDSVISSEPVTCAMPAAIAGETNPIWFAPSSFYRDAHPPPSLRNQVGTTAWNIKLTARRLMEVIPATTVAFAVALIILVARRGLGSRTALSLGIASLPVAMYLLVTLEMRYIAAFVVVIVALLVRRLLEGELVWNRRIALLITIAALADLGVGSARDFKRDLAFLRQRVLGPERDWSSQEERVVRVLHEIGVTRGASVVEVNHVLGLDWAQLSGVQVRAYTREGSPLLIDATGPDPIALRALATLGDSCRRGAWSREMHARGMTAAVIWLPPGYQAPAQSRAVERSAYAVMPLPTGDAPCTAGTLGGDALR